MHARGQTGTSAIANFGLALLVGYIMSEITTRITSELFKIETTSGPVVAKSESWLQTAVTNQPVMFLFFAFFSLIAIGVFEREVLR